MVETNVMHPPGPEPALGSPTHGLTRAMALLFLTGVGYYAAARLGYAYVIGSHISIIWPPSGLMLALLVRLRRRDWAIAVAGGFLGNLAADLGTSTSLAQTLAGPAANALEVVTAAWLLRALAGSALTLSRLQHVAALVLGAAIGSNAVTALAGALVLAIPNGHFWRSWFVWWAGDGMGMHVVAPVILSWVAFVE